MGNSNTCVVCNEGGNLVKYTTVFENVYYKHLKCAVKCKSCNQIHNSENSATWFEPSYGDGKNRLIHSRCVPKKCICCNVVIGQSKFKRIDEDGLIIKSLEYGKNFNFIHVTCLPSDKYWPILNRKTFHQFTREYKKHMLFQYWVLRNKIYVKDIIWMIISYTVDPYGPAAQIQNGYKMTNLCKCGNLLSYPTPLTHYKPECSRAICIRDHQFIWGC